MLKTQSINLNFVFPSVREPEAGIRAFFRGSRSRELGAGEKRISKTELFTQKKLRVNNDYPSKGKPRQRTPPIFLNLRKSIFFFRNRSNIILQKQKMPWPILRQFFQIIYYARLAVTAIT